MIVVAAAAAAVVVIVGFKAALWVCEEGLKNILKKKSASMMAHAVPDHIYCHCVVSFIGSFIFERSMRLKCLFLIALLTFSTADSP